MSVRGSEWFQWDLHFHTPSSYDYKDKSVTNEDIINSLKANNITVFAVTDHHSIDIQRYISLKKLAIENGLCVLPGIEFLSDARGNQPIHFIGLFSEESNLDYIWGQIKNKTAISKIEGEGKNANEVYCDLFDTVKLVKELGGIVTIHSGHKHGTIDAITNSLEHAVAQKIDIAEAIDIFELGKADDEQDYRTHVLPFLRGKIKSKEVDTPMIICSDNHNIRKYHLKEKLWIKGVPGFQGLKYALNEPDERFYIGDEPPILKKVRENKTKYIDSLSIKLSGNKDVSNIWFEDVMVPLNAELVTIIGNKGNGKSAIADIISLCMDGENSDDYSFLSKGKFLEKGLADRFTASVKYISGTDTENRKLDHKIDLSSERKVKYLPQSYFEKLCNEIGKVEAFRKEIEKVVFQYVPDHNKLKKNSFQELLAFKREGIDKQIVTLRDRIREKNSKVIEIEDLLDPSYLKNLKSKLKIKNDEIESHAKNIPEELIRPNLAAVVTKEELSPDQANLKKWEKSKAIVEAELNETKSNISDIGIKLKEMSSFQDETNLLVREFNQFKIEKGSVLKDLGLDIDEIIKITIDLSLIGKKIEELSLIKSNLEKLLFLEDFNDKDFLDMNPATKLEKANLEINNILNKLSDEEKKSQKIIQDRKDWEKRKNELLGGQDIPDSQLFLQAKIEYVENVAANDLELMRQERSNVSKELFLKKAELKQVYDEIKIEIDAVFSEENNNNLKIVSDFNVSDSLERNLFVCIKQNKAGTFYGAEESSIYFKENVAGHVDWNSVDDVLKFQKTLIDCLENDYRNLEDVKRTPISQIVKDRARLYDYLFGLEYLEPHYSLKQNGKNLEQLSPGEKGALLLVFYLVLDKDNIPLIIDQPEDNLDNSSVADILVPYIRKAKKQRQIIMVTHNPNLAVVADSEQVIRVSIDKIAGNKFSFVSGGIEELEINNSILDVLEGKAPAFKKRKSKYRNI